MFGTISSPSRKRKRASTLGTDFHHADVRLIPRLCLLHQRDSFSTAGWRFFDCYSICSTVFLGIATVKKNTFLFGSAVTVTLPSCCKSRLHFSVINPARWQREEQSLKRGLQGTNREADDNPYTHATSVYFMMRN